MTNTARWALPLLEAGQAQKEMTVNEAMALLDLLAQAGVEAVGIDAPPGDPAPGQCWIVGGAPIGAWAGKAGALAGWTASGWRFLTAREGMRVWSIADGCEAVRTDGQWRVGRLAGAELLIGGQRVVGARQSAIAGPTGGATADVEARATLTQVLVTLRAHGLIGS